MSTTAIRLTTISAVDSATAVINLGQTHCLGRKIDPAEGESVCGESQGRLNALAWDACAPDRAEEAKVFSTVSKAVSVTVRPAALRPTFTARWMLISPLWSRVAIDQPPCSRFYQPR